MRRTVDTGAQRWMTKKTSYISWFIPSFFGLFGCLIIANKPVVTTAGAELHTKESMVTAKSRALALYNGEMNPINLDTSSEMQNLILRVTVFQMTPWRAVHSHIKGKH